MTRRLASLCIYLSVVAAVALFPTSFHPSVTEFDWANISSHVNLRYHACYEDTFDCARLTLPLDWKNASSTHQISLAIIRLPATVPASHPNHGGTIILNPGGPGGSGVGKSLKAKWHMA